MIETLDDFMEQPDKFKNYNAFNLIAAILSKCDYEKCSPEDILKDALKSYYHLKEDGYIT